MTMPEVLQKQQTYVISPLIHKLFLLHLFPVISTFAASAASATSVLKFKIPSMRAAQKVYPLFSFIYSYSVLKKDFKVKVLRGKFLFLLPLQAFSA